MPLTKNDIQNVKSQLKQYMPDYPVPEGILKNPTKAFVVEFYTKIIEDIENRIYYITEGRTECLESLQGDYELEIALYRNLVNFIPMLKATDFTLEDILCPKPMRTNRFMVICIYFAMCTYNTTESLRKVLAKSISKRSKVENTELKNQDLLLQIGSTSGNLGIELSNLQETKDEHKKVKDEWKRSQKAFQELKTQADFLQKTCNNYKSNLERLEKTNDQLKEQLVPEEEQLHLKRALAHLLVEVESLSSTNVEIGDRLHDQKETIIHFEKCLTRLKGLHMKSNISSCHFIKQQLINKEQELLNITKDIEQLIKSKKGHEYTKQQIQTTVITKNEYSKNLETDLKDAVLKVETLTKIIENEYNDLDKMLQKITNFEKDTVSYKMGLQKLQNAFREKYANMQATRQLTIQLFVDYINKVKEHLN